METIPEEVRPGPSHCWMCGGFGVKHRSTYGMMSRTCAVMGSTGACRVCMIGDGGYTCRSCGVGWGELPHDRWETRRVNRANELIGIGRRFRLPAFIDHAVAYAPSPA